MGLRYLWSVIAAAGVMALLVYWRGFFVHHAFIVGLAAGALVYTAFGAAGRLRRLHR